MMTFITVIFWLVVVFSLIPYIANTICSIFNWEKDDGGSFFVGVWLFGLYFIVLFILAFIISLLAR